MQKDDETAKCDYGARRSLAKAMTAQSLTNMAKVSTKWRLAAQDEIRDIQDSPRKTYLAKILDSTVDSVQQAIQATVAFCTFHIENSDLDEDTLTVELRHCLANVVPLPENRALLECLTPIALRQDGLIRYDATFGFPNAGGMNYHQAGLTLTFICITLMHIRPLPLPKSFHRDIANWLLPAVPNNDECHRIGNRITRIIRDHQAQHAHHHALPQHRL